ncbi:biorientation of chromosomes in cell division protein 1-like 1 isoform X2 [Cloeon dipterum]|uniref:biorientation of chromosomes in cell division protein 1-like 1 isoform X2 n=1 Tax=Cloeon dipterum TaxID=197152 RepID=UPI00321FBD7A
MTDYVSELAHHYEADPDLTARIISQMKSKGYFDQLRKEILADIDTKPAYQNMRQRVENAVNRYLKGQKWSNELNKNKLRDSLRRHLTEGRLIHVGPVLNQVLTPDVCSQIAPEVDKQICQELGIPEDEEMPEEDNTPNNRRRDGDFDGPGGSSNGPMSFEPSYGGGRLNGRAWGNDNDFFYPYSGGYNRFSRRCENHDSSSSEEDEVKKTPEKIPVNSKNATDALFVNMSQFDEMELEYSKKEVVELERKENPEEATKLALEQLAAQKFKIEQELQRMELEEQHRLAEEQRRREFEQQQLRELEEQRLREFEERQRAELEEKLRLEFEERQRREEERLLQEQRLKEEEMLIKEESEEELEEPKTPEMSDGEDSDGPELQVAEEDSCQISTVPAEEVKPVVQEEAPKPVEPEDAPKPVDVVEFCEPARPEEPQAVPETPVVASPESEEAAPPVEIAKEPVKTSEQPKKRTDERSRSRDERHKSEHKKEHSSSSSSSKRHHSSSSSSKSSSHKSSSRRDSTSKHSSSSSRAREDSKSSSHRTSSRRDSEKHKSSSSSSSSSRHRRDDKHRSSSSKSSSSHKKGEDSNNLYYFTPEQSIEAVRSRIHLDEVMIRLEADNSGYDSLISDSETEDCPDKRQYEIEVENSDAIKIEDLLGIEIEGVNREESSLEEINANEIIKPPPRTVSKLHLKINNGTWNHSERADASFLSDDTPGKKVLSVVLEKCGEKIRSASHCSELDARSEESFVPVQQQTPPPKRRRIVRKVEQRYSTDDLYKPRTTFTSSRRSRE